VNKVLTETILKHIYKNFGIIKGFVSKSILDDQYLIPNVLQLDQNGKLTHKNMWSCQFKIEDSKLKILVGDISADKDLSEYFLFLQLNDNLIYGCYLNWETNNPNNYSYEDSEPMIAFNVSDKNWVECSTYLQATFLSGIEQIRDLNLLPIKNKEYKPLYDLMISFMDFYNDYYSLQEE